MKTALVISSSVAASRVGATASSFCLQRLGINTVVMPTTLLGRHPGWGAPGGGAISTDHLSDMWTAIQAQNIKFDAVLTGYMAHPDHVGLARDIITTVKALHPDSFVLVDPVMGDHGRLYVDEAVAQCIIAELLPLADLITPNAWEMSYITGHAIDSPHTALTAARHLDQDVVMTSVTSGDQIGAMLVTNETAQCVSHDKFKTVPHGGGDALAGTILAHILMGDTHTTALAQSVSSIFEIISAARHSDSGELPLIRAQAALIDASPLATEIFPDD